jgi:hypothetical protein
VLLATVLLVGAVACVAELRRASLAQDLVSVRRWGLAAGLLVAAVLAVRLQLVPTVLLVVLYGVAATPGSPWVDRIRTLSVTAAAGALATVAWCFGSWQSSGTPLFPLFPGNVNPDYASAQDPGVSGLGAHVRQLGAYLSVGGLGPDMVVVLVVVAAALVFRRWLPDPRLLVVTTVAAVGNATVIGLFLTVTSEDDFRRYEFPAVAAVVIVLVLHVTAMRNGEKPAGQAPPAVSDVFANRSAIVAAVLGVIYLFGPLQLNYLLATIGDWPGAGGRVDAAGRGPENEDVIATSQQRADYRKAQALLADRSAIAAVDRPFLLDLRYSDIPSLDQVGAAAPGGNFPLFGTTSAKVQVLRDNGFDFLLVTAPSQNSCSSPEFLSRVIRTYPRPGPLLARYLLAWQQSVQQIARVAPASLVRVGSIWMIDLADAEAVLRSARD